MSGLAIAPGEPTAERADYKQVFPFDRLQTKLAALNPKILTEGFRKHGYPPDIQEKATQTVLEQAKLLCAEWAE